MAGETREIDFEDAIGIASFQVAVGAVPHPSRWVDGMIEAAERERTEGFAGGAYF